MLKRPSKALAYRTPTPDELRENAYLTTLSLTLQEFVSITGRMPKDFKEVMAKLQLSQTLDEYSSDRVAQIEVGLNRSIPAIKTRIVYPEGHALDRLEIFTIDRKKGLVTTKLHTGTDTKAQPAFSATYEPFLTVEFPLNDPAPETAAVDATEPRSPGQ
jgi:hypothetical protein